MSFLSYTLTGGNAGRFPFVSCKVANLRIAFLSFAVLKLELELTMFEEQSWVSPQDDRGCCEVVAESGVAGVTSDKRTDTGKTYCPSPSSTTVSARLRVLRRGL